MLTRKTFLDDYRFSKGQLEPYPARPSHRRLIELLIAVIIIGGVFLYFWQSVLQTSLPAVFGEPYCIKVLKPLEPELGAEDLVESESGKTASFFRADESSTINIEMTGSIAKNCQIILNTNKGLSNYDDPYACDVSTIAYRSEEAANHLFLGIRSEFPQEIQLAGLPKYTYAITYYNPADRASYEATLAKLRNHECQI